jgi:hypothetical protein
MLQGSHPADVLLQLRFGMPIRFVERIDGILEVMKLTELMGYLGEDKSDRAADKDSVRSPCVLLYVRYALLHTWRPSSFLSPLTPWRQTQVYNDCAGYSDHPFLNKRYKTRKQLYALKTNWLLVPACHAGLLADNPTPVGFVLSIMQFTNNSKLHYFYDK